MVVLVGSANTIGIFNAVLFLPWRLVEFDDLLIEQFYLGEVVLLVAVVNAVMGIGDLAELSLIVVGIAALMVDDGLGAIGSVIAAALLDKSAFVVAVVDLVLEFAVNVMLNLDQFAALIVLLDAFGAVGIVCAATFHVF